MLRVIAGTAKGRHLETPAGPDVRPTLDRVREAGFSILLPRLEGARFADLFAGSGANGIEALSRGAASCVFVDSARASLNVIERNLERCRLADRASCYHLSLPGGLARLRAREAPFDVIYADPPFAFSEHRQLLASIVEEDLLSPQGVVVIEHAKSLRLSEKAGSLALARRKVYGTVVLSFFS